MTRAKQSQTSRRARRFQNQPLRRIAAALAALACLFASQLTSAQGVTYTKLYWADGSAGAIRRANLDGSGLQTLVTGLGNPYGIAVDSNAGWVYWSDASAGLIQRGPVTGGPPETLVSGLSAPSHVALDLSAGKIYWHDNGTQKIQRANLDGSGLETLFTGPVSTGATPWYGASWTKRKKITLSAARVVGTQTGFPVLISSTDANFTAAQANGNDFVFTAADGTTKLNHEIERFVAGTGELVAWVQVPSLGSGADTILYVYYGNPTATNQQNAAGVWDSSFESVHHLSTLQDSTSHNHSATAVGNASFAAGGEIASAAQFDGSGDGFTLGDINALDGIQKMTVSAWVRMNALVQRMTIVGKSDSTNSTGWHMTTAQSFGPYTGQDELTFRMDDLVTPESGYTDSNVLTAGAMHQWVTVYDGTQGSDSGKLKMYLDGVQQSLSFHPSIPSTTPSTSHPVVFGHSTLANTNDLDGALDEVRISTTNRSAAWIQTEYNNQSSPSTFHSFAAQETYTSAVVDRQGIAVDPSADRLYWLENTDLQLRRSTRAAGSITALGAIASARGLALDSAGGFLYWTEPAQNRIRRMPVGGGAATSQITGLGAPDGIALDAGLQQLYWTDPTAQRIYKRAVGGGSVTTLISSGALNPRGIALGGNTPVGTSRPATQALAEISPSDVGAGAGRTRFDYLIKLDIAPGDLGVDRVAIALPATFGPPSIVDIRFEGTSLTYSNQSSGQSLIANLNTRLAVSGLLRVLFDATAPIAVDPAGKSFPSTVDFRSDALPPMNAVEGDADGEPSDGNRWLVRTAGLAALSAVAEISPNEVPTGTPTVGFGYDLKLTFDASSTGVNRVEIPLPSTFGGPPLLQTVTNSAGASVPFTDGTIGNVMRFDLATRITTNTTLHLLFSAASPGAVDATGEEFRATIDDTATAVAAQTATEGNADGDASDENRWRVRTAARTSQNAFYTKVYWADGTGAAIRRANLDGTGVETLVSGLGNPQGLAIDVPGGWMYWTDPGSGRIERAPVGGGARQTLVSGQSSPSHIALDLVAGKMYWPENGTQKIQRANLDGTQVEAVVVGSLGSGTAAVPWYAAGWTNRKKISLDATKIQGTHTNFPVLISRTDAQFTAQASGNDFLFTAGDGTTKLNHEIESYNSATKTLVAWVRIPRLSATEGTSLYLYYGNAGAAAQSNRTGVWDTTYLSVHHLKDLTDSTANARNGTAIGAPAATASGAIGPAYSFDGVKDGVTLGAAPGINGASRLTISAWVQLSSLARDATVVAKADASNAIGLTTGGVDVTGGPDSNDVELRLGPYGNYGALGSGAQRWTTSNTLAAGVRHYWTAVFDGTQSSDVPRARIYLDGAEPANSTAGSVPAALPSNSGELRFMADQPGELGWAAGVLDEVRVSGAARSLDWVKTEYQNQSNPTAFHGFAAQETYAAASVDRQGIAVDPATDRLYWVQNSDTTLRSSERDGTRVATVLSGITSARGLAHDPAGRLLYWNEPAQTRVRRVSVDGGTAAVEVASAGAAEGVALDPTTREIYWSDTVTKRIQKAALGGGAIKAVVTSGAVDPRGIALGVGGAGGAKFAVASATAEITPNDTATLAGSTRFTYDISAAITAQESGVNLLRIQVPDRFGTPHVEQVLAGPAGSLAAVAFTDLSNGRQIEIGLASKLTSSTRIRVVFSADAPVGDDLTGRAFFSSLDDSSTAVPRQNTIEGDGDGDAGDANSWMVTARPQSGGQPVPLTIADGQIAPGPSAAIESCNWGASVRRDTLAGWANFTPATAAEISYLQSSDDLKYVSDPPGASKSAAMIVETTYSGSPNQALELNIYGEISQPGTGSPAGKVYACLWNYTLNRYDPLVAVWNGNDEVRNFHQVSDAGEYVHPSSGQITLLLASDTPNRSIALDVLDVRVQPLQTTSAQASYIAEDGWVDVTAADVDSCGFPARRGSIAGWNGWHSATSAEYTNLRSTDARFHEARLARPGENPAALYTFHFSEDPNRAWTVSMDLAGGTGSFSDDRLQVCIWNYASSRYEPVGTLGEGVGGVGNLGITSLSQKLLSGAGTFLSNTGELTLLVVNRLEQRMLLMDSVSVSLGTDQPVQDGVLSVAQDGAIDERCLSSYYYGCYGSEDVSTGDFPGPDWSSMYQPEDWADATPAERLALQTSDNTYYTSANAETGENTAHYFEFTTPSSSSAPLRIDLTLEVGRSSANAASYAYFWNWSSSSWTAAGNFSGDTDESKVFSITSNPQNYRRSSDGKIVVFVVNKDDGSQKIDYLDLQVIQAPPSAPSGDVRSALAEITPSVVTPATKADRFEYSVRAAVDAQDPGLLGTYYDQNGIPGGYFTGNKATRVDPTINFSWPPGSTVHPSLGTTNVYSVRWTGQIQTRNAGNYTFTVTSNQGARLYVNGVKVIDNFSLLGSTPTTTTSAAQSLAASTRYPVVLEFYSGPVGGLIGGTLATAVLKLEWTGPSFVKEVLPSANLLSGSGGNNGVIDRVTIAVPAAFTSPKVTGVRVGSVAVGYTDRSSGAQLAVDLAEPARSGSLIQLDFTANAPTAGFQSYDFTSTVDDRSTASPAQNTTQGDADGDPSDGNLWSVRTSFSPNTCLWAYRRLLTVQSSSVVGPLSDFPVLVSLPSDTGLSTHALASGADIVFTDAAGAMLDFEIESFTKASGALVAWVRLPQLSNTANTRFQMYYGYASATSLANPAGVWKNGYESVHHLGGYTDSSGKGHTGVPFGNPVIAAGKLGNGVAFDGNGDYVQLGDVEAVDGAAQLTVSAWVKPTGSVTDASIVSKYGGDAEPEFFKLATGTSAQGGADDLSAGVQTAAVATGSGGYTSNAALPLNSFQWVTLVFDGAQSTPAQRLRLYVNGAQRALTLSAALPDRFPASIRSLNFARADFGSGNGSAEFTGVIDEVQIATAARSAAWIQSAYNNQSSPATFVTTGSEESAGSYGVKDFQILHDGSGIHCLAEPVTVIARSCSGAPVPDFEGSVTLDTQTKTGDWTSAAASGGSFSNGTAGDGRATYGFTPADQGKATFYLEYESGTAAFDLDAYLTDNPDVRDDDSEGPFLFLPSGFLVTASPTPNPPPAGWSSPIANSDAATSIPMYLTAYGTTPDHPQCGVIETYTGDKPLQFWTSYSDPSTGTRGAELNGSLQIGISEAAATPLSVRFVNGQASFTAKYRDAGKIQIHAKDASVSDPVGGIRGATSVFVSRPKKLVIKSVKNDLGVAQVVAADANSLVAAPAFSTAGDAFSVVVEAWDAENNPIPNFGKEISPAHVRLNPRTIIPALATPNAVLGTIGGSDVVRDPNGVLQSTSVTYSEVGVIQLDAEVFHNGISSYLGSGPLLSAGTLNVGRFVPDRFEVLAQNPALLQTACGSFTYLGQGFRFATAPSLLVTAVNSAGATTRNYTQSALFQLPSLALTLTRDDVLGGGTTPDLDSPPPLLMLAGTKTAGAATFTYDNAPTLRFQRDDASHDGSHLVATAKLVKPWHAKMVLKTQIIDADGVAPPSGANYTFNWAADGHVGWNNGDWIRHGRMAIDNAYGSEQNDRPVPVRVEYYNNDGGWIRSDGDSCTGLAGIPAGAWTLSPAAFTSVRSVSNLNTDPHTGAGLVTLNHPTPVRTGKVGVTLDLPAAGLSHLAFDIDGDGSTNPTGSAYFGIFENDEMLIYLREIY